MVDGQQAPVTLNDVFYVPGAMHGLFSIGLAAEQGFDFDYDRQQRIFECKDLPLSNFTAAEGVASLKQWHERLGHTCPQYLKMMVDKGLVRGMLMKQRDLGACDVYHIGKQRRSRI
ncbi:hypothetical protein PR001_g10180 [Phytophthora rubi]|uniref:GAG-pre-integrase domain-containing protein n=1 Tax=Phytophthora rubi TaxID=129364 RepID=A0A6A3MVY5_9STRA|nr:hypothetical protein PR001_g10180 [Phytophthora rubi]